jgi:uncharacterized protein with FMN-binding domain
MNINELRDPWSATVNERFTMKFSTLTSILALAAAAFFTGVSVNSAHATQWFFSQTPDTTGPFLPADGATPLQLAAATGHYQDGSFTGAAYDAYYGMVQVQANIQGGQLVSVRVLQFPNHNGTSRSINRRALPILKNEVIRAQGTRVNLISGATLTSRAYLRSLNGALKKSDS